MLQSFSLQQMDCNQIKGGLKLDCWCFHHFRGFVKPHSFQINLMGCEDISMMDRFSNKRVDSLYLFMQSIFSFGNLSTPSNLRKPQETSYLWISVNVFLDQNLPEIGTSRVIQQTALIDVALSVNFLMLSFYERQ